MRELKPRDFSERHGTYHSADCRAGSNHHLLDLRGRLCTEFAGSAGRLFAVALWSSRDGGLGGVQCGHLPSDSQE